MYDPLTVAFEIKSPFWGKPSQFWPNGRRETWFTIWHHDPEKPGRGGRTDDSCGWFRPPTTAPQREAISKLASQQYSQIFERQVREREGATYAYVCFEPTAYDAIYWSWRAIKYADGRGWQYGRQRGALTASELEAIYLLSANPVDNVRVTVAGIQDADDFEDFFHIVWAAYRRHHRPWWRHPRWHVHHWRIQWHWLQDFNRWAFGRCAKCGGRFGWREGVCGSWGGDQIWHAHCDGSHVSSAEPEAQHAPG